MIGWGGRGRGFRCHFDVRSVRSQTFRVGVSPEEESGSVWGRRCKDQPNPEFIIRTCRSWPIPASRRTLPAKEHHGPRKPENWPCSKTLVKGRMNPANGRRKPRPRLAFRNHRHPRPSRSSCVPSALTRHLHQTLRPFLPPNALRSDHSVTTCRPWERIQTTTLAWFQPRFFPSAPAGNCPPMTA